MFFGRNGYLKQESFVDQIKIMLILVGKLLPYVWVYSCFFIAVLKALA